MITAKYSFYVTTQLPAGPSADECVMFIDFDTDNEDQAAELAERAIGEGGFINLPENFIPGTLVICTI